MTNSNKVTAAVVTGVAVIAALIVGFGSHAASPSTALSPHVMVIMEENKGYAATLGTCSADPYLCSLGAQNTSVVGWTGVAHPSEPNYLAATFGSTEGCTSDTCFKTLSAPSLGGELSTAGVPWTAYMESMPSACYTGQWAPSGSSGSSALYGEKHNPFVVAGDVLNNGCAQHVLPYPGASSMVSTLNGTSAPAFVWVTPNQQNDMHSNTVTAADNWLKSNLAPVLASSWFTNYDATVVITMDEDSGSSVGGGGPVPMVVISHNAAGHSNVTQTGDHYGLLRTIEEAYGLPLTGASTSSTHGDLTAFFGGSTSPTPTPSPTASPTPTPTTSPTPPPSPSPSPIAGAVQCTGVATTDTAALTNAVNAGGTVNIAAGTCALDARIPVNKPETISGAGDTATFLVQHAKSNIFQINVPSVTVENLNLDTYTYNQWVTSVKNPNPGTLFSSKSHTTLRNLISKANVGFGIRITGPSPCSNYGTVGTVVDNVTSTNFGTGGFTALDIDCTNGASITNVTIHGQYLALFIDENVTVNNLTYTSLPWMSGGACHEPIYVTGPAVNVAMSNITGGGKIVEKSGTFVNVTQTNIVRAAGC